MTSQPRFHLAVPVDDLTEARALYGKTLGLDEGRSSDQWMDWDFYSHQVVTHLADRDTVGAVAHSAVDGQRVPIPHFGLVLSVEDFHHLAGRLKEAGTEFVIEPYLRFEGQPGEQWTMFLHDPAGNAMEFKAFADGSQIFATS